MTIEPPSCDSTVVSSKDRSVAPPPSAQITDLLSPSPLVKVVVRSSSTPEPAKTDEMMLDDPSVAIAVISVFV